MVGTPSILCITESDLANILKQVEAGAEVVIERDRRAVAVLRPAGVHPIPMRSLGTSIAMAKRSEEADGQSPVMDPEFAADVRDIVENRRPREQSPNIQS